MLIGSHKRHSAQTGPSFYPIQKPWYEGDVVHTNKQANTRNIHLNLLEQGPVKTIHTQHTLALMGARHGRAG